MKRITGAIVAVMLGAFGGGAMAQDAANGADVFKKCRACHQIGEGAKNVVGPMLNGIVGRKAGSVEGFNYSEANKEAGAKGLVWTEAELDKYLLAPAQYMPKNKMAFVGVKDDKDRKDVIAFLAKHK